MKAKIIMLETTDKSNIGLFRGQLYTHSNTFNVEEGDVEKQHFYLIDPNADIKEGYYVIDELGEVFGPYENGDIIGKANRIICSTDKPLRLPLLSLEAIKLLVDYYNREGKMPDEVEVEFENGFNKHPSKFLKEFIKLNSKGEVDITIPEKKMYSREEVEKICQKAWLKIPNTENMLEEFDKWISKNS